MDQFYDIPSLSLPETADLLLTHELHMLVDLMGFSTGGRPELLALRPAPLQVAYMGYPGNYRVTQSGLNQLECIRTCTAQKYSCEEPTIELVQGFSKGRPLLCKVI